MEAQSGSSGADSKREKVLARRKAERKGCKCREIEGKMQAVSFSAVPVHIKTDSLFRSTLSWPLPRTLVMPRRRWSTAEANCRR